MRTLPLLILLAVFATSVGFSQTNMTATQAGDATYAPARPVKVTVVVR